MEPDHLKLLHERAKEDPYDPMVPNDLLQYWERKQAAIERERLIQERQVKLREQEVLRQRLAEERKQLASEGNINRLVEHRLQTTMGRGRGVSNLPAWVIEQQRNQNS